MNSYVELSKKEMQTVNGGEGFWYTAGRCAHKAFNEVVSWFE